MISYLSMISLPSQSMMPYLQWLVLNQQHFSVLHVPKHFDEEPYVTWEHFQSIQGTISRILVSFESEEYLCSSVGVRVFVIFECVFSSVHFYDMSEFNENPQTPRSNTTYKRTIRQQRGVNGSIRVS